MYSVQFDAVMCVCPVQWVQVSVWRVLHKQEISEGRP